MQNSEMVAVLGTPCVITSCNINSKNRGTIEHIFPKNPKIVDEVQT
jgi:hypothetical protein